VGGSTPTIYEWAGGRDAFSRWLNRFYDLVELEAPEIAAMFGGKVSEQHRDHVTDWWVEVMGGPAVYTEQRGGYEHMLARHHDLAISAEQRLTFVTLLSRRATRKPDPFRGDTPHRGHVAGEPAGRTGATLRRV
jgi:hemoglobin